MTGMKQSSLVTKGMIIVLILIGGFFIKNYFSDSLDMDEVNRIFNQDNDTMYFYQQLNEDDQEIYRLIFYAAKTFQEEVRLNTDKTSQVTRILYYVMNDHPELYYLDSSYRYHTQNDKIVFIPKWLFEQEKIKSYDKQIENIKNSVLKKVNQKQTDIEKAKVIYDYLIDSITYQEGKNDQHLISALIEKKSVCAGYAKAYQYLLNAAGIDSTYISGNAVSDNHAIRSSDGHAWVMLKLDGNYYYSDPTWGDVIEEGMKHSCSGYFLMDSQEMLKNYQPDVQYEKTAQKHLEYFEMIRCYMTSYDQKVLSHAVSRGLKNKTRVAEIKCANEKVYKRVKKALENEYLGYDVLSQNHCYSESSRYACYDELYLVELYF